MLKGIICIFFLFQYDVIKLMVVLQLGIFFGGGVKEIRVYQRPSITELSNHIWYFILCFKFDMSMTFSDSSAMSHDKNVEYLL